MADDKIVAVQLQTLVPPHHHVASGEHSWTLVNGDDHGDGDDGDDDEEEEEEKEEDAMQFKWQLS